MARKLKSDRILFLTTVVLVELSILMVYSASVPIARENWEDPYRFLTKQALWAALGMALLGVVMRIDYLFYRRPAFIWTSLAGVTVCLVAVLFMPAHNRAHRWFGFGGLGIQPSEFAKLAAIIFTAALLERRMHRINDAEVCAGACRGRRRHPDRTHPPSTGSRHGRVVGPHRRGDGSRGRAQLWYATGTLCGACRPWPRWSSSFPTGNGG